jgi:hypothetical protein
MAKVIILLQVIAFIGSSLRYFINLTHENFFAKYFFFSYQDDNQWYCKNETDCLPWKNGSGSSSVEIYENQNVCKLMCGQFAGLWPKPTGKCDIEKSFVRVNSELIR